MAEKWGCPLSPPGFCVFTVAVVNLRVLLTECGGSQSPGSDVVHELSVFSPSLGPSVLSVFAAT